MMKVTVAITCKHLIVYKVEDLKSEQKKIYASIFS